MTPETKQAMAAVHFVQELAIGAYKPHEIEARSKEIARMAPMTVQPEVGIPTSPQEPAFWIVRGRRGKRTWVLHPADSEVNARAVANGLKDATITPLWAIPQPALTTPALSYFAGTIPAAPKPIAKPAKTGRDLYCDYVDSFSDRFPPKPAWCELPDDEQAEWNAKAKEQA